MVLWTTSYSSQRRVEKIHDGRFIKLISKLLDAGYLEDWRYNQTLSGVPQGSIASPILSTILLDKLDSFVSTVLIPQYTRGEKRKRNKEYDRLAWRVCQLRKQGQIKAAQKIKAQMHRLPSLNTHDPNYRRLRYIRYADDFGLAFIGPKSEAEEIKGRLTIFLREELKLTLLEVEGRKYKVLQTIVPREGKNPLVATWGGIPLTWDIKATIQDRPGPQWNRRSELEKRLLAQTCEICGATRMTTQIEVHHIRALKDLQNYDGREKPLWVKVMAARRRKTLVLCHTCHGDLHAGRPLKQHVLRSRTGST